MQTLHVQNKLHKEFPTHFLGVSVIYMSAIFELFQITLCSRAKYSSKYIFFSFIVSSYDVHYQLSYFHQFLRYQFIHFSVALNFDVTSYTLLENKNIALVFFKIYSTAVTILKVDILRETWL